ncbi:hypothetical protein [Gelidibacter japonicus]|uniref:hypothetical protein n=1 Tax=Gelidibacter japonicus TaxID=1962232 RepID=UPI002B002902|nr:hypothetical protein [Gelidibacter japonicus]
MKKIITISFILITLFISSCSSTKDLTVSERDGSSYEKAVIVKSVAEEYEYAKKACQGCQLLGQSLSQYKNKPYDILRFKNSDGDEVIYYFDISKFYGKRF